MIKASKMIKLPSLHRSTDRSQSNLVANSPQNKTRSTKEQIEWGIEPDNLHADGMKLYTGFEYCRLGPSSKFSPFLHVATI